MFDSLNIFVGRNVKQFKTTALAKFKKKIVILYGIVETKQKTLELEVPAIHFQNRIVFLKNM